MSFDNYNKVVAIGGGHGLGRVLCTLSFLGSKLSGIVATTDNGGSTGRLRERKDCIAWGDVRNCLSQLSSNRKVGSHVLDFRFDGDDELAGHNLGNLILYALNELYVRPLESINLLRRMLRIETKVLPMTEFPTDLLATDKDGAQTRGEVEVDRMLEIPHKLELNPTIQATPEAVEELQEADLIILGPGSFLTSILPPLLLSGIANQIKSGKADVIFIDNLVPEVSSVGTLSLQTRIDWLEQYIGKNRINVILTADKDFHSDQRLIFSGDFAQVKVRHRHDSDQLRAAIESALEEVNEPVCLR